MVTPGCLVSTIGNIFKIGLIVSFIGFIRYPVGHGQDTLNRTMISKTTANKNPNLIVTFFFSQVLFNRYKVAGLFR